MRYLSLADEFEYLVEALRLGTPHALRSEAKKLRARLVDAEAAFARSRRVVDEESYALGALEAASDILLTTASRAERTAEIDSLRIQEIDLRVLCQVGLWSLEVASHGDTRLNDLRSQRALADATGVDPAFLSRAVLKRLREAGFITQARWGKSIRVDITSTGIAALDEVQPNWRTRGESSHMAELMRSIEAVTHALAAGHKANATLLKDSSTDIGHEHSLFSGYFADFEKVQEAWPVPVIYNPPEPTRPTISTIPNYSWDDAEMFETFVISMEALQSGLIGDSLAENSRTIRRSGWHNSMTTHWVPMQVQDDEDEKGRRYARG